MRKVPVKSAVGGIWLAWSIWWFSDGVCTLFPACVSLLRFERAGERGMADWLVLMLSGFPGGMYAGGLMADFVVGEGKILNGTFGYIAMGLGVIAVGFLQWFVLLPALWKRLRAWWCKS